MRHGVFPGSFDPLTIGHLAVADAARHAFDLETLSLTMSRVAIDKESGAHAALDERCAAIHRCALVRPWIRAATTDARFLVDIADGQDVLVVGADKWLQLHDVGYYGTSEELNRVLARLPHVAVAPRADVDLSVVSNTPVRMTVLDIDPSVRLVSSSAVRAGNAEWAVPGA